MALEQNVNVGMTGSSLLDKLTKNSKKIIGVVSGVALVAAVLVATYLVYDYQKPIAIINGEKITKKMARATGEEFKKFYQRTNDHNALSNLTTEGGKLLVEEKIIEFESAKRDITVSQQEIDDQFTADAKAYPSADSYLELIKQEYGWDKAQALYRIKIDLLRTKLADAVVTKKDVDGYYFRWDIYGKNTTAVNEAKANLEGVRNQMLAGMSLDDIDKTWQSQHKWISPASGRMQKGSLNATTEKSIFEGRQDWQAINKLANVGDVSEVVRSDGGYFAVYKLATVNKGSYDSWEDFLNSFSSNKEKIAVAKVNILSFFKQLLFPNSAYAAVDCSNSALKVTSSGTCCALADSTSSIHYATLKGRVTDNVTKVNLSGASLLIYERSDNNYSNLCSTAIDQLGGSSYSATTATDGTFTKGGIDCWLTYNVVASKTGYDDATWTSYKPTNGSTDLWYPKLFPSFTVTVSASPAAAANATNVLKTAHSGTGDCQGAGTGCYSTKTVGFTQDATQAAGYKFDHWSGNYECNLASFIYNPTVDVYLSTNKTCTANFVPIFNYNLTNNGNISVTKPSSGSVNGTNTITATYVGGTAEALTYTVSGLPAGVTAATISSCTPSSGSPCVKTNTLSISSSAATTSGVPITVTATSTSGIVRTTTFNLIINAPTPALNGCTVSPITGLAPLAVKIIANTSNVPAGQKYDFDLGDGTVVTNKPDTIYYTYSVGRTTPYIIGVRFTGVGSYVNCDSTATVNKPSTGGGNEVTP